MRRLILGHDMSSRLRKLCTHTSEAVQAENGNYRPHDYPSMQKPDSTCQQGRETNPRPVELASQPGSLHCSSESLSPLIHQGRSLVRFLIVLVNYKLILECCLTCLIALIRLFLLYLLSYLLFVITK